MERREKVALNLDDSFVGRLALVTRAAERMARELALHQATWEPHDWSEWS